MAASDSEGPGSHSKRPGSKAATASRHGISLPEASSTGAVPGTQDVYCPSWSPWGPTLQACAHHRQHPEPQLVLENTLRLPAVYQRLHSPHVHLALPSPHVQLALPIFPPWGPRALLCPEMPLAMEAREGHHMR